MEASQDQNWLRELQANCLRELAADYRQLNHSLFGGKLRLPILHFFEGKTQWGFWRSEDRHLGLNLRLLAGSWVELLEVLKHEMAHQYVSEVLGVVAEAPHGKSFQEVCVARGIDARARGEVRVGHLDQEPDAVSHSMLAKVRKLLSLAESENQHEAEAAMAQARRLMLRYNLEHTTQASYDRVFLGEPTGRRMPWQRAIAHILTEHFFVEVIIVPSYRPKDGKRGSVLEVVGTPENLELASYVHDFLTRAASDLWKAHKRERGLRRDSQKQSFLYGVMQGFEKKLRQGNEKSREQGLVWVADPELARYFRRRHPQIRRVGGRTCFTPDALSAGKEAGQRLVLRPGLQKSQKGAGRGYLLPKGSGS